MKQLQLFESANVMGRHTETPIRTPLPDIQGQPPAQNVETSLAAADAIRPNADTLRKRVYEYIKAQGKHGATDEEIQIALGMSGNTQRPRRVELFQQDQICIQQDQICMAPMMRRTRAGRQANVWQTRKKTGEITDCLVGLPVKTPDQNRVDEKYASRNGYSDLDRAFGTDWGNDER